VHDGIWLMLSETALYRHLIAHITFDEHKIFIDLQVRK
jgi:hypothetical protein